MSDGHDKLIQEKDKIDTKTIIAVGVAALAMFGLGIVWAVQIQKDSIGTIRSYSPEQVPVGRVDEVGIVYQPSFNADFATKLKAEQMAHLESVGWVDQGQKKVHIPIEQAIKDYLADSEKAGGKL